MVVQVNEGAEPALVVLRVRHQLHALRRLDRHDRTEVGEEKANSLSIKPVLRVYHSDIRHVVYSRRKSSRTDGLPMRPARAKHSSTTTRRSKSILRALECWGRLCCRRHQGLGCMVRDLCNVLISPTVCAAHHKIQVCVKYMCKIQWVHRRQRQNLHYGMANWLVILLIIVVDMAHAGILYSRSSIWGRATCRLAGCLRPAWRALSEEAGAGSTVADLYKARVANGASHYDETQYRVVQHLSKLQELMHPSSGRGGGKRPRGAYLCGSVGIGKTMMMDLFFESCAVEKKRRVHFHEFMLEVHRRVHDHKKALIEQFGRERHINLSSERDAIAIVAKAVAAESQLLCFDEFHVTDIADAMIMSRLFGELWKHGTVLVATSNRHPDDLYENGLNRPYFIPFIDMLKKQCVTVELNTAKDYRMEAVAETGAYFTPLSDQNKEEFYNAFAASSEVTGRPVRTVLPVMMGREVEVEALGDSCLISFSALCEADRGPADYHAIVRHYNRIYLDGVRQLSLKVFLYLDAAEVELLIFHCRSTMLFAVSSCS